MRPRTFGVGGRPGAPFGDERSTAPFNSEFSPEGRWLAYTLRTGNLANVYVEPYPATGAKYQITNQERTSSRLAVRRQEALVPSWPELADRG